MKIAPPEFSKENEKFYCDYTGTRKGEDLEKNQVSSRPQQGIYPKDSLIGNSSSP